MSARPKVRARSNSDWDALYRTAEAQAGYFTRADAGAAGFSSPLLHHHVRAGTIQRVRRGIYRLTRFPTSEHEDLVVFWLWSNKRGVFSHETALVMHGLSDALPSTAHLTLPASWRARRVRIPAGIHVHFADVPKPDRAWFESLPVTSPVRTVDDLVSESADPDLIRQAIEQGRRRGLLPLRLLRAAATRVRRRPQSRRST